MYSVIMAGRSDVRFWPLSRRNRPKQFLDVTGHGPMVLETYNRLTPVAQDEEMIIVVGDEHLSEAHRLFKGKKTTLLPVPMDKNTAPCIGLGAIYALHLGCEKAIAFIPAGHFIRDQNVFLRALEHAGTISEQGGIVTIGIVPTRPETGYGYIRRSRSYSDSSGYSVYEVSSFEEKPDLSKANEYMRSGEHYWNAGITVATANTILMEIKKHLPDLFEGLMSLEKSLERSSFNEDLKNVYAGFKDMSFSYGIMEKTKAPLFVVPCDCGWSDVDSWESLYQLRSSDYDTDRNLSDKGALFIDCKNNFISTEGKKFVACLGVENLIIVDTGDALLVANMDKSKEVRKIVEHLTRQNKKELL
jgi:mannose-1-phosphate guanylyltransferase